MNPGGSATSPQTLNIN